MTGNQKLLDGKKIILGITAGIAAYKAATLTRLLIKQGAEVKVVMTPLAKEFITPVTLATLSQNTVLSDFFNYDDGEWNSHVDLGLWADLYLIAPATANSMAKMAHGICDNLLLTTYLSVRCPVIFAPAMDMDMYKHPATQKNIEILKSYGNHFVEPDSGELASGLVGKGRMEEPEKITEAVINYFNSKKKLRNKRVLVTAGPTHEKIDPVRYIGNHSSGIMGYSIAETLANEGALVELVSGPVNISAKHPNIKVSKVTSATEMFEKSIELFKSCHGAIMSAAVADYTLKSSFEKKIKRKGEVVHLKLTPTTDIAAELGKIKQKHQFLVGFALETNNEVENAKQKLKKKNLDFIVLNSLNDPGAGFGTETNKITIISKKDKVIEFPLKNKAEVAKDIVKHIIDQNSSYE